MPACGLASPKTARLCADTQPAAAFSALLRVAEGRLPTCASGTTAEWPSQRHPGTGPCSRTREPRHECQAPPAAPQLCPSHAQVPTSPASQTSSCTAFGTPPFGPQSADAQAAASPAFPACSGQGPGASSWQWPGTGPTRAVCSGQPGRQHSHQPASCPKFLHMGPQRTCKPHWAASGASSASLAAAGRSQLLPATATPPLQQWTASRETQLWCWSQLPCRTGCPLAGCLCQP